MAETLQSPSHGFTADEHFISQSSRQVMTIEQESVPVTERVNHLGRHQQLSGELIRFALHLIEIGQMPR